MQNQWMQRISDYVDGEMTPQERQLFEDRLEEDGELRRAVVEVEELVGRAASLGPIEPERDLWPDILGRIGAPDRTEFRRPASPAPRPQGRTSRRLATWVAGVALVVVSTSAGWWLHDLGTPTAPEMAAIEQPTPPRPTTDATSAGFNEQEERLAESISRLETILLRHGDRLDPDTREAIATNLELIDAAIDDAHRALEEDPNSDYLHTHITNSLERKVRLLEDAARLASKEI